MVTHRRRANEAAAGGEECGARAGKRTVVRYVFDHLAAEHDVELTGVWLGRGKRRPTGPLGPGASLGDYCRGNVVARDVCYRALKGNGEDTIHTPEVQNAFAPRWIATEEHVMAPQKMTKSPLEIAGGGPKALPPTLVLAVVLTGEDSRVH